MLVDAGDGTCRECGGVLEIIVADDATMTVHCLGECGKPYLVEHDAFNDRGRHYWPAFMAATNGKEDHDPERPRP